jgi:hypothetical protein
MSHISRKNRALLLEGFREFFLHIYEAINAGRLEEALTIAETSMAFINEILEKEKNESSEDTNLFVFVENPQKATRKIKPDSLSSRITR